MVRAHPIHGLCVVATVFVLAFVAAMPSPPLTTASILSRPPGDAPVRAASASETPRLRQAVPVDILRVIDGEGQPRALRLLAIDAPESGQAGGEVARDFVAARACGSSAVEWQSHGQDRYGRTVASVSIDGEDLAVALLRAGLVWRVRKYLDGQPAELQSAYENAWRQARESRIGLWAGDPEPPWAWRQHSRPERGHGIDCSAYRGSLH
jgi:endonuclease YncB( thermonuclease family)